MPPTITGKTYKAATQVRKKHKRPFPKAVLKNIDNSCSERTSALFNAFFAENIRKLKTNENVGKENKFKNRQRLVSTEQNVLTPVREETDVLSPCHLVDPEPIIETSFDKLLKGPSFRPKVLPLTGFTDTTGETKSKFQIWSPSPRKKIDDRITESPRITSKDLLTRYNLQDDLKDFTVTKLHQLTSTPLKSCNRQFTSRNLSNVSPIIQIKRNCYFKSKYNTKSKLSLVSPFKNKNFGKQLQPYHLRGKARGSVEQHLSGSSASSVEQHLSGSSASSMEQHLSDSSASSVEQHLSGSSASSVQSSCVDDKELHPYLLRGKAKGYVEQHLSGSSASSVEQHLSCSSASSVQSSCVDDKELHPYHLRGKARGYVEQHLSGSSASSVQSPCVDDKFSKGFRSYHLRENDGCHIEPALSWSSPSSQQDVEDTKFLSAGEGMKEESSKDMFLSYMDDNSAQSLEPTPASTDNEIEQKRAQFEEKVNRSTECGHSVTNGEDEEKEDDGFVLSPDVRKTHSQSHLQQRKGPCYGRHSALMKIFIEPLPEQKNYSRLSRRVIPIISSLVAPRDSVGFWQVYTNTSILPVHETTIEKENKSCNSTVGDSLSVSIEITAKDIVLHRCGQKEPLPFSETFPESCFGSCKKIGEGAYGEVFSCERIGCKPTVMKIIPIEGDRMVNGETQKTYQEILSEIVIAMELSSLREGKESSTSAFSEVVRCWCVQGRYPPYLLQLWMQYDRLKGSENDSPDIFTNEQLFIILELANGGSDLESHQFSSANQALSAFKQVAYALSVAERVLQFEHRDLHWGNILISPTKEKTVCFMLNKEVIELPTKGVQVTIIDFTLSRMTYDECCIFNDLELDPSIFTSTGDFQFDVYRLMRDRVKNDWQVFEPYTNVLWLQYVLDKMIHMVHYRSKSSQIHKKAIKCLRNLCTEIRNFPSAAEAIESFEL